MYVKRDLHNRLTKETNTLVSRQRQAQLRAETVCKSNVSNKTHLRQKRPIDVKRDLLTSKETYLRQKKPICARVPSTPGAAAR